MSTYTIDSSTSRANPQPTPGKPRTDLAGVPVTEKSTHDEIDAHAAEHGIDLTGAATKADKLAAIAAADETQEV